MHLTDFPTITRACRSTRAAWERILRLREAVSKVLETARAARSRSASRSKPTSQLHGVTREALVGTLDVDLAKLFIVSHVDFARSTPATDTIDIEGLGRDRHHHVARARQKVRTLLAVPRRGRRRRRPLRAMR